MAEFSGLENAGLENERLEFGGLEKDGLQIFELHGHWLHHTQQRKR